MRSMIYGPKRWQLDYIPRGAVVCATCDDVRPLRPVALAEGECGACGTRVCAEHSRHCEEHGLVCVSCAIEIEPGTFLCRMDSQLQQEAA